MDAQAFRAQFPVLERIAYLNSGTDGPLPAAAVEAGRRELAAEGRDGRVTAHFERRMALQDELRAGYGRLLGAPAEQIALTTSASDGLGARDRRPRARRRATRSSPPTRSTPALDRAAALRPAPRRHGARGAARATWPRRSGRRRSSSRSRT